MLPVFGREVVESQQRVAILNQAFDRLVVFDGPGFDEGVERRERILLGLCHPDLLERPLGLRVLALRQLVQDVGGLVDPAALATGLRPGIRTIALGGRTITDHRSLSNMSPGVLPFFADLSGLWPLNTPWCRAPSES